MASIRFLLKKMNALLPMTNGAYNSSSFLQSFSSHGEVVLLPNSGLSLIKRPLNENYYDLAGVYPFSMCNDWQAVYQDIESIKDESLVSVVFVSDPFKENQLSQQVNSWSQCYRYKKHYTVNLIKDLQYKKELRRLSRRAMEKHTVRLVTPSQEWILKFWNIHQHLVDKHNISGMGKISLAMLEQQLKTPGTLLAIAEYEGEMVSAIIMFQKTNISYWYLMATHPRAYQLKSNYALFYETINQLRQSGIEWINLGGNAGLANKIDDGLARFKNQWANDECYSLLCGKVLNEKIYTNLSHSNNNKKGKDYFPAYR